jgi:hypothetical protein
VQIPKPQAIFARLAARPKETAVAVAVIAVLPILLSGGSVIGFGPGSSPAPVVFSTIDLRAGEVNIFQATFKDTRAEIELPRGFWPVVNGEIRVQPKLTTADEEAGFFRLLVPPINGSVSFNITSPQGRWTRAFTVIPGSEPVVSGEDAVGNLEFITQAFQHRFSTSPKLLRAAEHFRDVFLGLGLDTQMYFYPWYATSRPTFFDTAINIIVVCGHQEGTVDSNEWIVIGGHMDTVRDAWEGAYDDGSGTSSVLEVAQGLSQFKPRHTFVYCLWGGEEEGLYGSMSWVHNTLKNPVRLYVNMDMAGLSWPAPYNFTAFVGPDEDEGVAEHPGIVSALENITDRELRYPRVGNFSIIEDPFGRSDHVSFWDAGAPTVFFFGADDIQYPEYHSRDDTVATMVGHAGGRDMLVKGFDTLVWMALYLLVHADQEDLQ